MDFLVRLGKIVVEVLGGLFGDYAEEKLRAKRWLIVVLECVVILLLIAIVIGLIVGVMLLIKFWFLYLF